MAGEGTNGTPAGAVQRQLTSFIAEQLWAGQGASEVIAGLVERGLEGGRASALVNAAAEEMRRRGVL